MVVGGDGIIVQYYFLFPVFFSQDVILIKTDRGSPAQVRYPEGVLSITAVSGTKQGKERGALRDRQDTPVTLYPTIRRVGKAESSNFTDERIRHLVSF
jgi:hypothetical protein